MVFFGLWGMTRPIAAAISTAAISSLHITILLGRIANLSSGVMEALFVLALIQASSCTKARYIQGGDVSKGEMYPRGRYIQGGDISKGEIYPRGRYIQGGDISKGEEIYPKGGDISKGD